MTWRQAGWFAAILMLGCGGAATPDTAGDAGADGGIATDDAPGGDGCDATCHREII